MLFSGVGIVLAGLLGTLAMSTWFYFAHAFGVARHNPGSYLGTLIFGVTRAAFATGLVFHFLIGILAAWIYAALMSLWGIQGGVGWGLLFGAVHWLIVMSLLGVVAPLHPAVRSGKLENPGYFARREGWSEAAGSLIDHLLFGAIVGGTLGIYHRHMGFSVPYSFESWMQPTLEPSIGYLVLVIALSVLFIVVATITTKLGYGDEVFAAATPDQDDPDWKIARERRETPEVEGE
ncbi:hypothetical protein J7643_11810 [bacterium]|nr:hypothetical protein [bacterium]